MDSLEIRGLTKTFGSRRVLDDLSFTIPADGDIWGVFGPNGVGKTTLFRCIMGLEHCQAQRMSFAGTDLRLLPPERIARCGVSLMFQRPAALEGLTVSQHLGLLLEERTGKRDAEVVAALLSEHGLESLAGAKVGSLSFGEAKLVDFVRAMMLEPKLLMLDEPFSGMDPHHITAIKQRVRCVCAPGRAILVTDHNLEQALPFVDHVLLVYEGRLLFEGTPEQARADSRVRGLYLGDHA